MDNIVILPLCICLIGAFLSLLIMCRSMTQKSIHLLAAIGYLASTVYLCRLNHFQHALTLHLGGYPAGIGISFVIDAFSCLMLVVTALLVMAVSIYSLFDDSISHQEAFYPLFWLMITGATGVFSTADIFNLYVWFEVMIIASIALMVLSKEKNLFAGTLHYVALNLLATLLLLLAIAFLYGASGTLDISKIAQGLKTFSVNPLPYLGLLMLAFAIKSALFPYCFWLPASYHLTSVSAGCIFAGILTKAGLYALFRFNSLFLPAHSSLISVLVILSSLTMLTGVFGAMSEFNLRRILSFHIISQIGYMTLGLAMGGVMAISAALFFMIHNIFAKTNLFLVSGLLNRYTGHNDLRQMGGFFRLSPWMVWLFFIPAFSLAGLPPLSGFWGKYLLIKAAFNQGFWLSAFIALLVGFFTLYSMVKIWRYAYLQTSNYPVRQMEPSLRFSLFLPLLFLSLIILTIGLFPQLLYTQTRLAALALMQPEHYFLVAKGGVS